VYPVFFGAALKDQGVVQFLDGLQRYTMPREYPKTFGARVFKISRDDRGERLVFAKITGGTLNVYAVDHGIEANDSIAVCGGLINVKSTAKEISIEYIQKIVCDYFGIPVESINAKTRKREIVQVRQISMYFAKKYTHLPLSVIGAYCGNKDHATVLHACRTIRNLSETDKKMKQYISDIDKKMKIGNI
jgi:hypothetical protein